MAEKKMTTYQFMLEIAGRVDSSFGRATGAAGGNVGKLQSIVKKFGAVSAGAFAAKKVIEFAAESTKAAMEFESSMADVAKVVDGLKDSSGKATAEYAKMSQGILDLSKKLPMTAEDISTIVASAGQAGIARKDLLQFAEDATKMGIAFDVTAEQAGDWMAQWRTALKLNQGEVVTLADQINYLGNTSSEKASKLANIVSRVGSLGQIAGLSGGQVAALGAATTGIEPEVAATGLKKLMTTMTAGASATAKQKKVLDSLGISATDLAKRMQTDAQGAIMDLLGAINKLPKAEQTAAIKNYFGAESLSTIAVLSNNLGNLKSQFDKVGDSSNYAGSMQGEYEARAATTENSIQLMKNSLTALKIQIGTHMLPIVGKAAKIGASAINGIAKGLKIAEPYASKFFGAIGKAAGPAIAKLKPLGKSFMELGKKAAPILKVFGGIVKVLGGAAFQRITGVVSTTVGTISSLISSAMKILGGICDFVTGVFTGNWSKAWEGVRSIFAGIWGKFTAIVKAPINTIISLVNSVIGGINSISFDVPSWVPKIGGDHIGFDIATIPMLAKGGIVTKPTLAMVGEGREPEVASPLSKLKNLAIGGGPGIVFSPVINVSGGGNVKAQVIEAMRLSYEEFKSMMQRYERERQRLSFA